MNRQQYQAEIARIAALNPSEPLMSTLANGPTDVNVRIYLPAAQRRVPNVAPSQLPPPPPAAITIEPIPEHEKKNDPTYLALTADIRRAYNNIRQVRNGFHACKTDAERAIVSDKVREAWQYIMHCLRRRKQFEIGGIIMPQDQGEYIVPDKITDLVSRLHSVRASISRYKSKGDPKGKLSGLENQKILLENALKERKTE